MNVSLQAESEIPKLTHNNHIWISPWNRHRLHEQRESDKREVADALWQTVT